MKKNLVSFVCVFFLFESVNAQDCCKIVEIEFNDRSNKGGSSESKLSIPKKIKLGEFYQVKIKNINQNLFLININNTDTILSTKSKTPTFEDLNLSLPKLDDKSPQAFGISSFKNTISGTNDALSEILSTNYVAIIDFNKSVSNIVDDIDKLKVKINNVRLQALLITGGQGSSGPNFESYVLDLQSASNNLKDVNNNVADSFKKYLQDTKSYQSSISENDDYKKADEAVKANFVELQKNIGSLKESISADKAFEYLFTLVTINNNSKGDYYSLPLQYSGEQTRLLVSITPRDTKYNLQSYSTQIIFPLVPPKYNVTGVSYYFSWLTDEEYSIEKPTDTTYRYSFHSGTEGEGGLAASYRAGIKMFPKSEWFGAHISLGAGLSLSKKIRPRILLGGGLSFGKKHMLAVDGGFIFGYVDKKNSTLDFTKTYSEKQRPEPIIVSQIEQSCYLSIGYLFSF
jgi:hypothetical protein